MSLAWHVATTKPFSDLIAERDLERQGFTPFNPKVRIERVVRGQRIIREVPYIPGYIFVHFDVEDWQWRKINTTRGIRSVMYSSAEVPAVVRSDAMSVLLERCNGQYVRESEVGAIDDAIRRVVWKGAQVRVNEGPLEGRRGSVTWAAHDRVKVLMLFLGTSREIEMAASDVAVLQ